MKKNKTIIDKSMKRQYYILCMYNIFAFFIVFLIMGVFIRTFTEGVFYRGLIKELEECSLNLQIDSSYEINNPRFLIINYDENKEVLNYSNELLKYFETENYLESSLFTYNQDEKIQRFEVVIKNELEFYFLTTSLQLDEYNYMKILVMVNGEKDVSNDIAYIYLFASIFALLFGVVISFMLGRLAIKPLGESINNQLAFVSDASHELKTPLSIMQSKLENVLAQKEKTVFDVSLDIAILLEEISRLTKLTNNLLELTKNAKLNYTEIDLYEHIQQTSQIFKEIAILENKVFEVEGTSLKAYVDKTKITQLLLIIFDNAIKYTNEFDIIKVTVAHVLNNFVITITDTGIGVSEETKKKIFERFYREDKARSKGGNGLGLAIAKKIVTDHKGKIIVEHNEPKGTKFIITISIKPKNF